MTIRLLCVALCFAALSGCYRNYPFQTSCTPDYWHDSDYQIFGRKNCVGDQGRWIDEGNGRGGYYCKGANCVNKDRIQCKDTCNRCLERP
jgi:hypothetical protein